MCLPIHYPDDRQMRGPVNEEHELVLAEESAVVDGPGGLQQISALGDVRSRKWRSIRKYADIRLDGRYDHLKPFRKATNAFANSYRKL
jgi:hypothetical protein